MQRDIRKWFMKPHDKDNSNESKHSEEKKNKNLTQEPGLVEGKPSYGRKKTSKYFAESEPKPKDEVQEIMELQGKKKLQENSKKRTRTQVSKKLLENSSDGSAQDIVVKPKKEEVEEIMELEGKPNLHADTRKRTRTQVSKKLLENSSDGSEEDIVVKPKKAKSSSKSLAKNVSKASGKSTGKKESGDENYVESDNENEKICESRGRGRGGRGGNSSSAAGTRGRGGRGRGGFMKFGERKDPPHKGEKEVPDGLADCLAGLTFVISGTLDSLEREEAEDLIKRHGGRITSAVSKKTSYLLCDEDVEGRKSTKAKELGIRFLTEDGLFDMIRDSKCRKGSVDDKCVDSPKKVISRSEKTPKKEGTPVKVIEKESLSRDMPQTNAQMTWTEKYKPKTPNDIVGNQSLVNQVHSWLKKWDEQFSESSRKGKGKRQSDGGSKKALLLSGSPGIGKTTTAKLVSQMLGYLAVEVNASDSRGKADGKIFKGIGGSNANCIKELVSNQNIRTDLDGSKHQKSVLIMDEVDGMSAGDRGGVADLINSIKLSKIPIICICNDRYSQKLKSLVNNCLVLGFRKPTKQQMAKRLMQVANSECLQINTIALEELAEGSNGDMRMALNQLQYLSLSMSVLKYDDVRKRLISSSKDEDISPFTAVDKMFGYNGRKLKMDERINLSMSDIDLVPLIVQENYINYRPSSVGKDDNGIERLNRIVQAAESIADGDLINVQIRRHWQWQLSQTGAVSSSIIPSALLHGHREVLEEGERNFNRFGGWLGKNSTFGKNMRLLEDLHYHLLASRETNIGRETIRLDYQTLFLKRLTDPLRVLPKDEGVRTVVKFMNEYSVSQDDVETLVDLSKFKGLANPLDDIPSVVKAALTRAYKEDLKSRMVRSADLIQLPGIKKAPKKRVASMLETLEDDVLEQENADSEQDDASDNENMDDKAANAAKIESLSSNGIKVDVETNGKEKASAGKRKAAKSSEKVGKGSVKRKR